MERRSVGARAVIWAVLSLALVLGPLAVRAAENTQLVYRVIVLNPQSKIFHVCGEVEPGKEPFLQLDWPAWTPGYATLSNYGQNVIQVTAKNEHGAQLAAQHLAENRWVIQSSGARKVEFCYDVRAIDTDNDLGFAQAYLDSSGGWFTGAAIFPEIDGFRDQPHSVHFEIPKSWRVATAMKSSTGGDGYQVMNYDELVDSPVQLGVFVERTITVAGVPISIVVAGRPDVDMDGLATTTRKIAEYEFLLMGGPPFDRYLFIYHAARKGAGGLEHRHAVTISLREEEYNNRDSWLKVVAAHELFHVWNAKRIHTELFDHYDYSRPHRSKQVWFAEGITAYYTDLTLYRADLTKKEELYRSLAEVLDQYENNRAHPYLSWEDISWYIWDEEVRQGLGVWLLPGWMIDLKIRDVTDNRFSLDDVMRFMNLWYGEPERGYPESGLGNICSAVAQHDLRTFFDRHIAGYEPFPYDSLFAVAGLRWNRSTTQVPDVGCELFWSLQTIVKAIGVEHGGPAARAGLQTGDIVLDLDRVVFKNRQDLAKFKAGLKIGDTLRVHYRRGSFESTALVQVGSRPLLKSSITEVEHPSERQRLILDGILRGLPR